MTADIANNTHDREHRIPDTGQRKEIAGHRKHDTGRRAQGAAHRTADSHWIPDTGHRTEAQDMGYMTQDAGHRTQDTGPLIAFSQCKKSKFKM